MKLPNGPQMPNFWGGRDAHSCPISSQYASLLIYTWPARCFSNLLSYLSNFLPLICFWKDIGSSLIPRPLPDFILQPSSHFLKSKYLQLGETKVAELSGMMTGKSDKAVREWRAHFNDNGEIQESKQGKYQRSSLVPRLSRTQICIVWRAWYLFYASMT